MFPPFYSPEYLLSLIVPPSPAPQLAPVPTTHSCNLLSHLARSIVPFATSQNFSSSISVTTYQSVSSLCFSLYLSLPLLPSCLQFILFWIFLYFWILWIYFSWLRWNDLTWIHNILRVFPAAFLFTTQPHHVTNLSSLQQFQFLFWVIHSLPDQNHLPSWETTCQQPVLSSDQLYWGYKSFLIRKHIKHDFCWFSFS